MSPQILLLSFALGSAVAAGFFATLWLTARRLPAAHRPALLMFGGLAARMALAIGAFGAIASFGRWEPLIAALGGFVAVRVLAVRLARPTAGAE